MIPQRYVSEDLTHFVGRSIKGQQKRYSLLKKILRGGVLKAYPRSARTSSGEYPFDTDPDLKLSTNEACGGGIVCFCDIPLSDLPLHMRKYSTFGMAFSKRFLVDFGASPVIYVPRFGRPALLPYNEYGRGSVASQAVAFDDFWKRFNRLQESIADLGTDSRSRRTVLDLRRMFDFVESHIVSNLKFFDHRLDDSDDENFYMEREWRVSQDIPFSLLDVQRIIIPTQFARNLRRDFPDFDGEIVFADAPH